MTMEISERHCSQALDDVVEALMETGVFRKALRLCDVLEDVSPWDGIVSMVKHQTKEEQASAVYEVRTELERALREKLENHYEVCLLAADYQRAAAEDMREEA